MQSLVDLMGRAPQDGIREAESVQPVMTKAGRRLDSRPMEDVSRYRLEVELRDGTPAVVRAIRPEDKNALQWGFDHLSQHAIYHRFFQAKRELSETELRYLTEVDFVAHVGLVVEVEVEGVWRVIGVGRFVRLPDADGERDGISEAAAGSADGGRDGIEPNDSQGKRAEVAFTVGDEYQGRGVATILLEHLSGIAWGLGYRAFEAEVMPENRQMRDVFQHSGLVVNEVLKNGLVHVELAFG